MAAHPAPRTYGAEQLPRTTLQLAGNLSAPSVALVIRTLQRVPGVLLAEMNAASARAIVAHDAAVTGASLVAAAVRAGVNAVIVGDSTPRAPAIADALPSNAVRTRQVLVGAAIGYVALTCINALLPNSTRNHWIFAVALLSGWLLFLVAMIIRKKF